MQKIFDFKIFHYSDVIRQKWRVIDRHYENFYQCVYCVLLLKCFHQKELEAPLQSPSHVFLAVAAAERTNKILRSHKKLLESGQVVATVEWSV